MLFHETTGSFCTSYRATHSFHHIGTLACMSFGCCKEWVQNLGPYVLRLWHVFVYPWRWYWGLYLPLLLLQQRNLRLIDFLKFPCVVLMLNVFDCIWFCFHVNLHPCTGRQSTVFNFQPF